MLAAQRAEGGSDGLALAARHGFEAEIDGLDGLNTIDGIDQLLNRPRRPLLRQPLCR